MFKTKSILAVLILVVLISCARQNSEVTTLYFENDLIPEGIAIDGRSKKLYLNSLKDNKIVSCELNGNNPNTFLQPNQYGYLSGFGMTIKGDTLYALGNSLNGQNNKSILLLLQLSTGYLIDSYALNDSDFHYLNDLTISSKNEIYITDSESNKVYKIERPSKNINVYLDFEEIANSNGITISSNNEYLYLASTKGISIVEINTKKVINTPNENFSGIDGLKYYNNNLYAIVNGWSSDTSKNGLFKFELNVNGTRILDNQKIVEFTEGFNIPTNFDIVDEYIYFIINTQLDNFDGNTNEIMDLKKLKPYKLMKTEAP